MSEQRETTVGALTAADLGSVVEDVVPGGELVGIEHWHGRTRLWVRPVDHAASTTDTWPHGTPCTVSLSSPVPGTPGEREEGADR